MKRQITWFLCLVPLVGAAVFGVAEGENALAVPAGAAPMLDGVVSEGEWSDALELPLADDTFLFVKHAEGFLYLGVRTAPGAQVVGNVYIARDEVTVEILHASHALGPASYRYQEGVWVLETPFAWSCRTLGFSDTAIAEREAFLEEKGWLATVVNLGVTEQMEYRIAIDGEPMRTLFRFDVYRETQEVLTWPLDTAVGIEPGPLPQEAAFRPETWCDVSFRPSEAIVSVPAGTGPTLDGTLSDGEWDDAQEIPLDDRTSLFLKHARGKLFLGLSTRSRGVVSPCIVRGDDVWVLHASAVLGTAIYEQSTDAWTRAQDFTWSCRSTGFGEGAIEEREAFFEREGWLGTIGYLGIPTQSEYRIDLLGENSLTILFLFLGSGYPRRALSWPVGLADTPEYTALVSGQVPETMSFDIATWARLLFESTE